MFIIHPEILFLIYLNSEASHQQALQQAESSRARQFRIRRHLSVEEVDPAESPEPASQVSLSSYITQFTNLPPSGIQYLYYQ